MNAVKKLVLLVVFGLTYVPMGWAQVCTNAPSGIVAWWPGDGNTQDIIGGNNGTLNGGATFQTGKVDQAFSFGGNNGFVSAAQNGAIQFGGNDFTIECWIKTAMSGGTGEGAYMIMTLGDAAGLNWPGIRWQLFVSGGTFQAAFSTGSANVSDVGLTSTTTGVDDQTWKHVAVTRQGDLWSLYLNGNLEVYTTHSGTVPSAGTDVFRIGRNSQGGPPANPGQLFNGLVDEVSVYNRALSAAEIQGIFQADSGGKCKLSDPQCQAQLAAVQAQLAACQAQLNALSNTLSTGLTTLRNNLGVVIPGNTIEEMFANLVTAITNMNPGAKNQLKKELNNL